MAIIIR